MDFVVDRPPRDDELEISLFGPGTGEAVAIHLGRGKWGLVDSCRHPVSRAPVVLDYFATVGVAASDVVFLFASHWHDDHVNGLADVLAACGNAEFGCSQAYTEAEFRQVVSAYENNMAAPIQELGQCLDLIKRRPPIGPVRHTHTRIAERATLWSSADGLTLVRALAPTPQALARAERTIGQYLLPTARRGRSFGRTTPNQASIVLVVETTGDSVLLGGDLEESGSGGSGWSAVITRLLPGHRRSSVFKIPHHGSAGAHLEEQWTALVATDPISVCTTYASSRLPRRTDLARIRERSRELYLAGSGSEVQPQIAKAERTAMTRDGVVTEPARELGHIRLRQQLSDHAKWEARCSDGAVLVTADMVKGDPDETRPKRLPRRRRPPR